MWLKFRSALFGRRKAGNGELVRGDEVFMNDLREAVLIQKTPGSWAVLGVIASLLVLGLVWAAFSRVEETTRGEGVVVPSRSEQIVQSLEGGLLEAMYVREGDIVEEGQALLRIDATLAHAAHQESYRKAVSLGATIERLRAEAHGLPLRFSEQSRQHPDTIALETGVYQARRRALEQELAAMQQSYSLAMREVALAQPLADRGLLSQTEILRMRRQANDLQRQIIDRRNSFRVDASGELSRFEHELAQVREHLAGRRDVVERTVLSAPVKGTVKQVHIATVGGVIRPGEPILAIVPLEDRLLIETRIKPQEVAFLRPGLPATVKITAYDYAVYGGLEGQVEIVGASTIKDDYKLAAGAADASYYRVVVRTDAGALHAGGKSLPIIPGMTATVEIRTGEKSILDYLLKPVLRAREAFRER